MLNKILAKYCIAWIFGDLANLVNHWWFVKFTIQIFAMSRDINKESKQTGIHPSFTHQFSDGKFAKVFLFQTFALHSNQTTDCK